MKYTEQEETEDRLDSEHGNDAIDEFLKDIFPEVRNNNIIVWVKEAAKKIFFLWPGH